jgi:diaminopimelate epimerase
MRFEKWQALGNDYIVIERERVPFELTPERIRRICEPHFGVGADGVLLLSRPKRDARAGDDALADGSARAGDEGVVASLAIYNPDGSRAELSGNGSREAILYLRQRGWTDADEFAIATDAGIVRPQITGQETCRVDLGVASLTSKDYPGGPPDGVGEIEAGDRTWSFRHVSVGNPQCAIAMQDLETLQGLDLAALGPSIEGDHRFLNRTNVSFYAELQPAAEGRPARLRARIFERGAGETLSSGTGASGAAIAYVLGAGAAAPQAAHDDLERAQSERGDASRSRAGRGTTPVQVILDGGELLVEVGEDLHVHLTGWARPVFEGRLSERFVKELHETE